MRARTPARRPRALALLIVVSLAVFGLAAPARPVPLEPPESGRTVHVSVDNAGDAGNGASNAPSASADGRFVAFESRATNLVPGGDDNGSTSDIFVYDRLLRTITIASVGEDGRQGPPGSDHTNPSISADGSLVAFESEADKFVAEDDNGVSDIYVRDLTGDATFLVSRTGATLADAESRNPSISDDGSLVAFETDSDALDGDDKNGRTDVYLHDRGAATSTQVSKSFDGSEENGDSLAPDLSGDGETVTYTSGASNIVAGDTNGRGDVFAYDVAEDKTTLVSLSQGGDQGDGESYDSAASADGRHIVFTSLAGNLVDDDTNGQPDILVRDLDKESTVRVSVTPDGDQADRDSASPSISADGRTIAFESNAALAVGDTNDKTDVYTAFRTDAGDAGAKIFIALRSIASDDTLGDAASRAADVSADGASVAFDSEASTFASGVSVGDPNVYVNVGLPNGTTESPTDGSAQDAQSEPGETCASGDRVVFATEASDLVPGDTDATSDVFVFDRTDGSIDLLNQTGVGRNPVISDDCNVVAWEQWDIAGTKVDIFVQNIETDPTPTQLPHGLAPIQPGPRFEVNPSLSYDGRCVAFESKWTSAPGQSDARKVFVYDFGLAETAALISLDQGSDAEARNPSIDNACTRVAYEYATVAFVHKIEVADFALDEDVDPGRRIISRAPDGSLADGIHLDPDLSADGEFVVWRSDSSELVSPSPPAGVFQVYLHRVEDVDIFGLAALFDDLAPGDTVAVSVNADGDYGNADSGPATVGRNGTYVAYETDADNIAVDDTNQNSDVIRVNTETGEIRRISLDADGENFAPGAGAPAISANGRCIVYLADPSIVSPSERKQPQPIVFCDPGVPSVPPEATFFYNPKAGNAPLEVSFNANASDFDGDVVDYDWDFGDGKSGSGETTTHTYLDSGSFTPELTVTDNDGESTTIVGDTPIDVNAAPTAVIDILSPATGTVPLTVDFDGSSSFDPDGTVDEYHWDFGDGATSPAPSPSHEYTTTGTFDVSLTVTDDDGAEDTLLLEDAVAVDEVPPTPPSVALESIRPGVVGAGDTFELTASATPGDNPIAEYRWDADGDGTFEATTPAPADDPLIATHSASIGVPGVYVPAVFAVDSEGLTSNVSAPAPLTVLDPACEGDVDGDGLPCDVDPDDNDPTDTKPLKRVHFVADGAVTPGLLENLGLEAAVGRPLDLHEQVLFRNTPFEASFFTGPFVFAPLEGAGIGSPNTGLIGLVVNKAVAIKDSFGFEGTPLYEEAFDIAYVKGAALCLRREPFKIGVCNYELRIDDDQLLSEQVPLSPDSFRISTSWGSTLDYDGFLPSLSGEYVVTPKD